MKKFNLKNIKFKIDIIDNLKSDSKMTKGMVWIAMTAMWIAGFLGGICVANIF
jgi:hypothetical protein